MALISYRLHAKIDRLIKKIGKKIRMKGAKGVQEMHSFGTFSLCQMRS